MITDKELIYNYLRYAYQNFKWWIPKESMPIIEKYAKEGDIHAILILAVEEFHKSPIIVDINGKQIAPLHEMHKHPIAVMKQTLETLENKNDVSDMIVLPIKEYEDSVLGLKSYCYRILGHIYSGKWGKIPYDYDLGEKYYRMSDELNGIESWEIRMYSKECVQAAYQRVLNEQILNRTELDVLEESVTKSGVISSGPTDPDLRAEYAGKDRNNN